MKIKNIFILSLSIGAWLLAGCETAPIDEEQYFKQVYLVGASAIADGPFVQEVHYSDQEQETYFSIATGGSLNIEEEVNVNFDYSPSTIKWYNNKYLFGTNAIYYQQLPEANFRIEKMSAVIPAGEVYARVPVYVKTTNLHCDSLYVIPLRITSADLPHNEQDTALMLCVKCVNNYSGIYQMTGKKSEVQNPDNVTALTAARTLIAVDVNTVRYYFENIEEKVSNAAANGIIFKVNPDNSVTVAGYDQFVVNDGGGTWDPGTKSFTVWYTYNSGNTEYRDDLVFAQ